MQQSLLLGVRVGLLELDLPALLEIGLVSSQSNNDIGVSASLQLLHPALGARKGIGVGNVLDDNGGTGAAVVHGSERTVPFLASRVPNLEFDSRIIQLDSLCQKGSL